MGGEFRSTPTPPASRATCRWRPLRPATSSSPGRASRTNRVPASSRVASRAPARRSRPTSRSTPTPPAISTNPRSRLRPPAPSSSSGRAGTGRAGRRHLRSPLLERRRRAGRRVPGQHLHAGRAAAPAVALESRRRLRGRLDERPGRLRHRRVRPAVLERRPSRRRRVQVNTFTPSYQVGPHGVGVALRRLRRGVGQLRQSGRQREGSFRSAVLERGRCPRRRVPGQYLHRPGAAISGRGGEQRRRLHRRLGERYGQDGDVFGIVARRFTSAGVSIDRRAPGEHVRHRQPALPVGRELGIRGLRGRLAEQRQDGATGIFARRFSAAGVALTPEFQANTYTTSDQGAPAVAPSASGFVRRLGQLRPGRI